MRKLRNLLASLTSVAHFKQICTYERRAARVRNRRLFLVYRITGEFLTRVGVLRLTRITAIAEFHV